MDKALEQITVVLSGIIGVAILAVLVSRNAQTSNVITSFFKGFGGALQAAEAPIIGPSGGFTGFSGVGSSLSIPSLFGA